MAVLLLLLLLTGFLGDKVRQMDFWTNEFYNNEEDRLEKGRKGSRKTINQQFKSSRGEKMKI